MLNESQQKPKPRRAKYPQEKEDETNDVQIESEKGKEENKNNIHKQQRRKKEDSTPSWPFFGQPAGEDVATVFYYFSRSREGFRLVHDT